MPAVTASPSFTVSWAGADEVGLGSGIASFTVSVSDNGGPLTPFLQDTTQTSATFTGLPGHTYSFFCIATDNVGHVEAAKTTPDTQTTILRGTTTTITSNSPNLATTSQALTLTVSVTPAVPDGETVTLKDASNGSAVVSTTGNTLSGGQATLTVAAGTLSVGTHSLFATYSGDATYAGSQSAAVSQVVIDVAAPPLVITWSNPADIIYGTPLSALQLDAAANVPGTFRYTLALGTTLPAGIGESLSVTFTPNDTSIYTPATATVTINVTPAPLTILPASGQSKVYGVGIPVLAYTPNGFVNGDSASILTGNLATIATAGSAVGGYAFTLGTLNAGANYALALAASPPIFAVTPAILTVTAANKSKTYGDPNPPLTGTITGEVTGDNIMESYSTAAGQFSDVAPYPITVSLADPDGKLSNYTVINNSGTLIVNKANQVITWSNPAGIIYGTALSSTQLNATVLGVGGGSAAGTLSYSPASGTFLGAGLGQALTVTAAATTDYNLATKTVTIDVGRKTASVTPDAKTKVYGDGDPILTGTLSGFLARDNVSASYGRTLGQAVTGGPYTISAALSPAATLGNYTITYNSAGFTITPALLTVSAQSQSKVYGAADPTLSYLALGYKNGDTSAILSGNLHRAPGEKVASGPYPIDQGTLAATTNYTINFSGNSLTITPAPLLITGKSLTKILGQTLVFAGTEFTSSGLLGSDMVTTVTLTSAAPGRRPWPGHIQSRPVQQSASA